jgi:ferric-dicitrate binding protein FerR (iron transport regulator)
VNVPRLAGQAARLLREHRELRSGDSAAQARGVETIQRAMAARRTRRVGFRWLGGVASVAACGLLWFSLPLHESPSAKHEPHVVVVANPLGAGAQVNDAGQPRALRAGVQLAAGDEIDTPSAGGAVLDLSTGTRLQLEAQSALMIRSQGALQSFTLASGALSTHVAKLAPDERFVIDTADAQIEVRGTAFRLQSLPQAAPCSLERTRLDVSEGVVEVRSRGQLYRVVAGQSWPPECAQTAGAPVPSSEPAPRAAETPNQAPLLATAVTAQAPKAPETAKRQTPRSLTAQNRAPSSQAVLNDSTLAAQSDLFARALAAQKRGSASEALTLYSELMNRYPATPLAENALAGRVRILSTSDRDAAKREAARYLERYPKGFARAEAERIVEAR